MKVAKFGGTSTASAEQIKRACGIMLADTARKIMVVSAPGKRFADDAKVTDLLINLANAAYSGSNYSRQFSEVCARFAEIAAGLGLDGKIAQELDADLKARLSRTDLGSARFLDLMKVAGENGCARLVAAYLQSIGAKAQYVDPKAAGMLLSDEPANAHILPQAYPRLCDALNAVPGIAVFPGFFGYTEKGDVVTFSRGGSDITGSILAAAMSAEVYENYTDVDGVFAASPKIVNSPMPVREITYWQMRELTYAGFNVFHEEAIEPVFRAKIPIEIKNTFNPDATGTRLVFERTAPQPEVVAIAGTGGFCNLTVAKFLMNREIGFGRRLFQILEEEKVSFDHAPSGIDNISPILRQEQLSGDKLEVLERRIKKELNVDAVSVTGGIALIVLVAESERSIKTVVARAVAALCSQGTEILVVNMSANGISMTLGVSERDLAAALRRLYAEFFL